MEFISPKLVLGDVLRLCWTYLDDLTSVLLPEVNFEFELLVVWYPFLLSYYFFCCVTDSYFFVELNFLVYVFFNPELADATLYKLVFYFFFDFPFYMYLF